MESRLIYFLHRDVTSPRSLALQFGQPFLTPAALEIYMVYAFLIQKVHEEGREEERTPRKCKNGWRIKASDTAVTLHALKLFSTVWATSENRGSYPLLAGVIVYHPSRKQSNCLHGKVIVVKHLMYLLLSSKSI